VEKDRHESGGGFLRWGGQKDTGAGKGRNGKKFSCLQGFSNKKNGKFSVYRDDGFCVSIFGKVNRGCRCKVTKWKQEGEGKKGGLIIGMSDSDRWTQRLGFLD